MLINSERLLGYPILSLHMGGMIARTNRIIIDPDTLNIVAFEVMGPGVGKEFGKFLQTKDVREFSNLGMVIDSADEFVNDSDVIKLEKVLKIDFKLDGIKVETKKGTRLGKVGSYTVEPETFSVQQLVVQRPLLKSFIDPELVIGRSEIKNVELDKVIVKDEEAKIREKAVGEDFVPNFVNPFREPRLSTADNQTLDEPSTQ